MFIVTEYAALSTSDWVLYMPLFGRIKLSAMPVKKQFMLIILQCR